MPISNGRNLAKLLGSSANIRSRYVAPVESGSSVSTLADMDALIAATGMSDGDQAFVLATNNLYIYKTNGWFKIATVENLQPGSISGVESSYALANDGTATTITAVSEDPEGFPLTWSYAVTTGSLGNTATISQTDNVFTITPSTDEANAGEFSITFSVTDEATGVVSAVSAFTLSFGVDISQATYDNVSFSVASQDTIPFGMVFNTDGSKMYMCGWQYDSVYQYSLSTAFDLSTATYDNVSFSVASQDTLPMGVFFNPDGTQMYILGLDYKKIFQYSLSTAYDLSTASYSNISFSTLNEDSGMYDMAFNGDGTKMYTIAGGSNNHAVFQYSLTTAYNVGTASYDSVSFSVSSQETTPQGFRFISDGTQLFVIGQGSNTIFQYSLSTAYDISTASYDSVSFSAASQDDTTNQISFSADYTKLYVLGAVSDTVYQYSTGL